MGRARDGGRYGEGGGRREGKGWGEVWGGRAGRGRREGVVSREFLCRLFGSEEAPLWRRCAAWPHPLTTTSLVITVTTETEELVTVAPI